MLVRSCKAVEVFNWCWFVPRGVRELTAMTASKPIKPDCTNEILLCDYEIIHCLHV